MIPCPNPSTLRESEQCSAPLECAVYVWKTSAWGLCSVLDPGTKCGRGTQRREVACYSSKGLRVVEGRSVCVCVCVCVRERERECVCM